MPGRSAVVVVVLLASAAADARKKDVPLTPDQQLVVAAAIDDTFPLRRHDAAGLVLCLDVQVGVSDDPLEPPPPPARGGKRKKERPPEPVLPIIRGAPPDLIARVVRPWRTVVSATACRLDPRAPFTLDDELHTPARLVTVRIGARVATGTLRIDWSGGTVQAPTGISSRDCTAAHGPQGWTVHCGGTWSE